MTQLNLDQKAAKYAQEMITQSVKLKEAKKIETLITKTLGVLQEQGVYACILFLFSRTSDEAIIAPELRWQLYKLLQAVPPFDKNQELAKLQKETKSGDVLIFFSSQVCNDLDTLFLVKELYEQTLIYARYGAKAAKEG